MIWILINFALLLALGVLSSIAADAARAPRDLAWHGWFAWRPVRLRSGVWAWLRPVRWRWLPAADLVAEYAERAPAGAGGHMAGPPEDSARTASLAMPGRRFVLDERHCGDVFDDSEDYDGPTLILELADADEAAALSHVLREAARRGRLVMTSETEEETTA